MFGLYPVMVIFAMSHPFAIYLIHSIDIICVATLPTSLVPHCRGLGGECFTHFHAFRLLGFPEIHFSTASIYRKKQNLFLLNFHEP